MYDIVISVYAGGLTHSWICHHPMPLYGTYSTQTILYIRLSKYEFGCGDVDNEH